MFASCGVSYQITFHSPHKPIPAPNMSAIISYVIVIPPWNPIFLNDFRSKCRRILPAYKTGRISPSNFGCAMSDRFSYRFQRKTNPPKIVTCTSLSNCGIPKLLVGDHRPRQATANDNDDSPHNGIYNKPNYFLRNATIKCGLRPSISENIKVPSIGTFFTITGDFFLLRKLSFTN